MAEVAKTFFHELGHGTNASMRAFVEGNVDVQETRADFAGIREAMNLGVLPHGTGVRFYSNGGTAFVESPAAVVAAQLAKLRAMLGY